MKIVFKNGLGISDKIDTTTISQKIFVYDSSHGVAAEVRKKLSTEYTVVCCVRSKDLKKFDLNDFFAAIIIINDFEDLLRIETFRRKIKNLIISSSLKKDNFSMPYIENSFVFDLFLPREETIVWLREKLQQFNKKIKIKKSC